MQKQAFVLAAPAPAHLAGIVPLQHHARHLTNHRGQGAHQRGPLQQGRQAGRQAGSRGGRRVGRGGGSRCLIGSKVSALSISHVDVDPAANTEQNSTGVRSARYRKPGGLAAGGRRRWRSPMAVQAPPSSMNLSLDSPQVAAPSTATPARCGRAGRRGRLTTERLQWSQSSGACRPMLQPL